MPLRLRLSLAMLCLAVCCFATTAGAETFRARYVASLLGFPIGRADLTGSFDGGRFRIEGRFGSAGLARLFDPVDGSAAVGGRFARDAVRPAAYRLDYTSGGKRQKTAIRFAGEQVAKTENVPPLKKHRRHWVPLADDDLAGVSDPLSALMIPVNGAGDVCNRTLKVYDGEMRANLVLTPAAAGESLGTGTVTCRARFVPVSGYRKNRSALVFLRDRSRILVAFAPVGGTGLQSPVEATIGTQIGTVRIRAQPVR